MHTLKNLATGLLLGLAACAVILLVAAPPSGLPVEILPSTTPPPLIVYVSGAVVQPGLYTLPSGSRVADALTAAGGALAEAEISTLNPAQRLLDGQKIHIPAVGENQQLSTRTTKVEIPLDLNNATAAELEQLPGIGPTKAADIISHRQKLGGFDTIEQILDVPGIGQAVFEQIKDMIAVAPRN